MGDMSIDQDALLVSWKGQTINLSGTEFRMLAKLVRVPGHAVSYDTLMNATMQSLVTNNTINTHMRNIRKSLRRWIRTSAALRASTATDIAGRPVANGHHSRAQAGDKTLHTDQLSAGVVLV